MKVIHYTAVLDGVYNMRKNIFFKQQRGGMLVELMMSLAIAAIMIPFLFRYQQNTVERARNIAVTKQMETVQSALEKYIIQNRALYTGHSGNHTWSDVHLCNLIDAHFLPNDFSNDCPSCGYGCNARKGDETDFGTYSLRVLKNQDVLQGVVLLDNEDTRLRTREIVNLGGGKIGYVEENDKVRGGFNVFLRPTSSMGLSGAKNGLVGTTKTFRGNNEYLWRVKSSKESDATMQSPLNLDGHDIVNVNNAYVVRAVFNTELNAVSIIVSNVLSFLDRPTFNLGSFSFLSEEATIRGLLISTGTLIIENTLHITGNQYSGFENLVSSGAVDTKYLSDLQNLEIGSSDKPTNFEFKQNLSTAIMDVEAGRKIQIRSEGSTDKSAGITPRLSIANKIEPSPESTTNKHYWKAKEHKVYLPNIALTNLPTALEYVYEKTHTENGDVANPDADRYRGDAKFGLFSDRFLFEGSDKVSKTTPFLNVLGINLCKIKKAIEAKYYCLETGHWTHSICRDYVLQKKTDEAWFKDCKPGYSGGQTDWSSFDSEEPDNPDNPDNPWVTPDNPGVVDVPVDPTPDDKGDGNDNQEPGIGSDIGGAVDKTEEEKKKEEEERQNQQQPGATYHIRSL